MAKHTTKEAYYERLKNLANVNKTSVKESTIRNLGSLIDYKRASDGIAYGIIKENHHYYIKKAGTKQDPNVADFAYIGGMSNITDFQFKSLGEADKQRNMIFHDINEAKSLKPNKTKSKMILTEDVAKKEIDQAASKVPELDAATSAEKSAPEGSAEMSAGIDAMPAGPATPGDTADPSADPSASAEPSAEPSADAGENPEGDAPALPADNGEKPEGEEELSDLQKKVSDIAQEIQTTDLDGGILSWLLDRFIRGFVPDSSDGENAPAQSKMAEIDDSKRHELADMILNVVPPEEIDKLGDSVPQEKPETDDLGPSGLPEAQCAECGSFAQYAESRGYGSAESLMECGEEEVGNLVSGYANAHNDGQNDGDIDNVAMIIKIINPEMLNSLKGDYGHEDYANKLEPIVNGMNECSQEEGVVKINELFGGLGQMAKDAWGGVKKGATAVGDAGKAVGRAVGTAVGDAGRAVGTAATNAGNAVQKSYYTGEKNAAVQKLQKMAVDLKAQLDAYKANAAKSKTPDQTKEILKPLVAMIKGGAGDLSQFRTAEGIDPAGVEVQPVGQAIEEIKVPEKKGKPLSTSAPVKLMKEVEVPEKKGKPLSTSAPVKIMKEEDEPEGEEVDFDDVKDGGEEEKPFEKSGDKPLTGFAPAAQSLGGGVVKPESAPMTTVDVNITPDKAVSIQMSESEIKLRKYIRERLEVKAGLRKASLNENKKSPTLKKLDTVIDNQFKLFEGVVSKKKVNEGLSEISTGLAQQAGRAAGSKIGDYRSNNDTIGAAKTGAQQNKFGKYINPELLSYLKSQGVISAEGYGDNGGMYMEVPGATDSSVYIVVGPDGYHFYNSSQNASSLKPEMVTKLPTLIKRVQADLRGEKSRVNPSNTPAATAPSDPNAPAVTPRQAQPAVNEIFGWSVKEKFAELDPNDAVKVDELFQQAFKNILINPHMSAIGATAKKATPQEKYALLQQYVSGGGGTLRVDQNTGKLTYASKEYQDKGTSSGLSNKNYSAITK